MAALALVRITERCKVRKIRPRNYLLEQEVDRMVKAARGNRHGDRVDNPHPEYFHVYIRPYCK